MTDHEAIATAWAIHGALSDWTGKVDVKASFALTLESAVLAGVVALSGDSHRLSHLHKVLPGTLYWLGIVALIIAIVFAALVVKPSLRSRAVAQEARTNFIFFGHLKEWTPEDLTNALENSELLPVLARQLINMSDIAWRKHRKVQFSMLAAGGGTALLALAAIVR